MAGMNQNLGVIAEFYSKLNDFREAGEYTDVFIQCEDQTFECHKLALALASNYFKAMFAGNFIESTKTIVPLSEVDAETFKHILRFIYSGGIEIDSDNVSGLFWASDFLGIQRIENLCIGFVEEMKATLKNIVDIFVLAQATNKHKLLEEIEALYFVPHLSILSKTSIFLEVTFEYMSKIIGQYMMSKLSLKNDNTLLPLIMQWICHRREERLQYLNKFLNLIQLDNISPQYNKFMVEEIIASNPVPSQITQLLPVLKYETFLHVFIKFTYEEVIRIYSINNTGNCNQSGSDDVPPEFHNHQHVTVNDMYIYRLQFITDKIRAKNIPYIDENFSVASSVNSRSWLALAPPPVKISIWPRLCNIQNNIYLYDEYSPERRSKVLTPDRMFTDEFYCGIYGYNCDLDKWFPVPLVKKNLNYSHLKASGDILYLVGQGRYPGSIPERLYVRVYDFRMRDWQELPSSNIEVGSDSYVYSCCTLDSKIYAVHCYNESRRLTCKMTRYDIISAKWESINTNTDNLYAYFPTVTPYKDKIWLTEAFDSNLVYGGTELTATIYDPVVDKFFPSRILMDATRDQRDKFEVGVHLDIVDCLVSKK